MSVRIQQLGGHHRRQRQCQHGGENHCAAHCYRQFIKQNAHVAVHENNRDKHGNQHGCGGDHSKRHLSGTIKGRQQWWLSCFDSTLDILKHHNRIIDDQSNTKHHGKQCDQIDGQAKRQQHHERCQQADRNGHRRNQHAAHGAQEHINHKADQHHSHEDGGIHRTDRIFDKLGIAVRQHQRHVIWQGRVDAFDQGSGFTQHRQAVGI